MPLLSFFVVLAIRVMVDGSATGRGDLDPLGPLPWGLLGLALARPGRGRKTRGLGFGLVVGALASFVLIGLWTWAWNP